MRSTVALAALRPPDDADVAGGPDRSSQYGSRRCSNGWSMMPTERGRRPRPSQPVVVQAELGGRRTAGEQVVEGGGSPSGGSQICAPAGPAPTSRPTTMSSRLRGALPPSSGCVLLAGSDPRRSRERERTHDLDGARGRRPARGPRPAGPPGEAPETYAALKRVMPVGVELEVAVARRGRQLVGVGDAEHDPALHRPRRSAGRCGRTGACPGRAAGPPPAAGRPAAGARRGTGRAGRSCTNSSMNSGLADSSSLNSSQDDEQRRHRRQSARRAARARS